MRKASHCVVRQTEFELASGIEVTRFASLSANCSYSYKLLFRILT